MTDNDTEAQISGWRAWKKRRTDTDKDTHGQRHREELEGKRTRKQTKTETAAIRREG